MKFSSEELIEGIRNHDRLVLAYLYKDLFYQIRWLVIHNHGTEEEAKDIFQDALIIVHRKIKAKDLHLTCSLSTFIYSVCRYLWLKELHRRNRFTKGEPDDVIYVAEEPGDAENAEHIKQEIFLKHFNELSRDCKKILNLHLNNVPIPEITKSMGYRNDQYTMERKYRCKNRLIEKILKNPLFRQIKDEP
jgi:RNA polymerase sigma factor (sigma-70 family)